MRNLTLTLVAIISSCFITTLFAQQRPNLSSIEEMIEDVYQEDYLKRNPKIHQLFRELLTHRITYQEEDYFVGEKYKKLSEVPLARPDVPALERDQSFEPATFNPLKYAMVFFAKYPRVYRVDNTNYIIIISPQ